MDEQRPQRAGPFETLGAWLHIWTPPRDLEVPPVPWRKVAVGAALLALAGIAVAVFVAPEIDEGKQERAARQDAQLERGQSAERARIRRSQRPRWGTVPPGASRAEAIAALGEAVGRDARARFDKDAESARCEPAPGADPTSASVLYDCHSKTSDVVGGSGETVGALTLPYRGRIFFNERRYAFCRVHPRPGERWITDPRKAVLLPRVCSLYRS